MAVTAKSNANTTVKTKAKELLAFAHKQMGTCRTAPELFLVIFGPHGKAKMTFPTKKEWSAFQRTEERREIERLIETFAASFARASNEHTANGHPSITLRLPKSVHQTLLAEAAKEGVSLDQLCLSKLVAQLRRLV